MISPTDRGIQAGGDERYSNFHSIGSDRLSQAAKSRFHATLGLRETTELNCADLLKKNATNEGLGGGTDSENQQKFHPHSVHFSALLAFLFRKQSSPDGSLNIFTPLTGGQVREVENRVQ